jgi:putative oligomerization/nucleic acid binding protein
LIKLEKLGKLKQKGILTEEEFQNLASMTIYGGRVFHVTYAARIEEFSVGLPAIEKMIDSFQKY